MLVCADGDVEVSVVGDQVDAVTTNQNMKVCYPSIPDSIDYVGFKVVGLENQV